MIRPLADPRRLSLAALVTLVVVVPALWPQAGAPAGTDLLFHGLGGAMLAWVYALVLQLPAERPTGRPLLAAFLVAVAVGAGIEFAQAAVPGRQPAIGDALAHGIGAAIAVAVIGIVARHR